MGNYVPEPLPLSLQRELQEYLFRELMRIGHELQIDDEEFALLQSNPTISGTIFLTLSGNVITATGINPGLELGSMITPNTPYIDFHTSGNAIDFDSRIIADGGTGTIGEGQLQVSATPLYIQKGQLRFPAAQNASADPNTLDDYEEQTYTPVITASAGTFTSITGISGAYRKVGSLVVAKGKATITTVGTATGNMFFTLPFTSANDGSTWVGVGRRDTIGGELLQVLVGANSNQCQIIKYDNTSPIAATAIINWTVSYWT